MYLRKLIPSDAPLMLEWMSDPDITQNFLADFASMTLTDVNAFIDSGHKISQGNINVAVSSDDNTYMGTVSLKHIDFHGGSAEFAIVMRKCAMGKGYAWFGMSEIIAGAFRDLNLSLVYWNVLRNNFRAVRFYDKHNFPEMLCVPDEFMRYYNGIKNLKWYSVNKLMTQSKTPPIIDSGLRTQDSGLALCLYRNFYSLYPYINHINNHKKIYFPVHFYMDGDFFVRFSLEEA